jgi:hypothetical protein
MGAVVKGRRDKGRWTKGRRRHKVDIASKSQKADDRRWTGMVKETKVDSTSTDKKLTGLVKRLIGLASGRGGS